MLKYKNALLILLSLVLFAYAGFVLIFPSILKSTFNIDEFEEKVYKATGLITALEDIDYKIYGNFDVLITLRDLSFQHLGDQPLFSAKVIELKTTVPSILTKNINIKSLYLKHVKYFDQILPDGKNKLDYLPAAFDSEVFGTNNITLTTGPVKVKNFKITYFKPGYALSERNYREKIYEKDEVKNFLSSYDFSHVKIK